MSALRSELCGGVVYSLITAEKTEVRQRGCGFLKCGFEPTCEEKKYLSTCLVLCLHVGRNTYGISGLRW